MPSQSGTTSEHSITTSAYTVQRQRAIATWGGVVLLLLLAIFLRFNRLAHPEYWWDESMTSLNIAGYTMSDLRFENTVVSAPDLLKYQRPDGQLFDCLRALCTKGGHHPPLYYALAYFWAKAFGAGIFAMRFLPAIFSVLVLPAIYWLCVELFASRAVAAIATVITALSPYQIMYAQEAREYSLWFLLVAASTAALLRAMRKNTTGAWSIFLFLTTLSLYTFPFSLLVLAAQTVWAQTMRLRRTDNAFNSQLRAALTCLVLYLPWIVVIINGRNTAHQSLLWEEYTVPIRELIGYWCEHVARICLIVPHSQPWGQAVEIVSCAFAAWACYYLWRRAEKRVTLLLVLLFVFAFLPLAFLDLVFGGIRSSVDRYLWPSIMVLTLASSFAVSELLRSRRPRIRSIGMTLISLLCIAEILSYQSYSKMPSYLDRYNIISSKEVARSINGNCKTLLICSSQLLEINRALSLSHYLSSNVDVLFYAPESPGKIPNLNGYERLYLLNPEAFGASLDANRSEIEPLEGLPHLCKVADAESLLRRN